MNRDEHMCSIWEGSLTREGDSLVLSNIASSLLVRAETFLPKINSDGSTLAHLQHLHSTSIRAILLAPETGMSSYAGTALFGTFGESTLASTSTLSRPPSLSPSANSPRTSSTLSTPLARRPRPRCAHPPLPEHAHRDDPHQSPNLPCPASRVPAIFTGQFTGRPLSETLLV
ncbi:hypothetical protein K438DRAFT_1994528 [Mycena galopus ATCC 62051]|nr:hypothetical protein K438DRAFT_1994528 [Mycena galopus ATCC 62051]